MWRESRPGQMFSGLGPRLGAMALTPLRPNRTLEPYGTHCCVGPIGSGKTLLAVHFCLQYARGQVFDPNTGGCVCGDEACPNTPGTWRVYTNLKSTWKGDNPNGWAYPLDMANQVLDGDSELKHAIILLDEFQNYADSRRAMKTENIDIARFLSQIRKRDTKLIATAQSFDFVDTRIRALATRVYNCWTPNRGVVVNAQIHLLALGHLPPWQRNHVRPLLRSWVTRHTREYYDTHERITADEMLGAKTDPLVYVIGPDGRPMGLLLRNAVQIELERLLRKEDVAETTPEELASITEESLGVPVGVGFVRRLLYEGGFPRRIGEDGKTRFVIKSTKTLMELEARNAA